MLCTLWDPIVFTSMEYIKLNHLSQRVWRANCVYKNKPKLIWCGTETLRCYVCLEPVCMQWPYWITFRVGLMVCGASEAELPGYLVRSLPVQFLDFFSGDWSYLDILSASHGELSRYFSDFSRWIFSIFLRRFTVNFLTTLSLVGRWIM